MMILRSSLLAVLAALSLGLAPALSAPKKPVVVSSTTGQYQQIQPGDTLLTQPPLTDGSVNLTPGSDPSSPTNGSCWINTTAGLKCQVNGVVITYGASGVTSFNTRTGAVTLTSGDVSGVGGLLTSDIGSTVQAWSAGLDSLAGLSATGDLYYLSAAHTWSVVTIGTGVSFTGGTLSAAGSGGTVTSIVVTAPLTGGTITTSGSIGLPAMLGASTYTAHGVVLGEGTSALGVTTAMTGGQLLVGQGSTSDPSPETVGGDATLSAAGSLTVANNAISFAKFAQGAANTVPANATGSMANYAAFSMPSCSAVANALIWTTNTGFGCQNPIPATSANPFAIGPGDVGFGNGIVGPNCLATTALPEGSLCGETDTGATWVTLLPVTATPTRVQEAVVNASYTVTLGATPTPGDELVAMCSRSTSLPVASSGWISRATHNQVGNDPFAIIVSRLVQTGDTTSQTPCTGTASSYSAAIKEVSGVDMVDFNNSIQNSQFGQQTVSSGGPSVTLTFTTTTTNTLGLSFVANNFSITGVCTTSIAGWNSGWINTVTGGGDTGSGVSTNGAASQTFASSGASVTATTSSGACFSSISNPGMVEALIILQAPTGINVGQQQLSLLTKVYNSSSLISPAVIGARSLNFSTGLTATDDGNGNETITATASGTVTTTGSPSSGNLTKFSGSTSVTNADLTGDCTTSGTVATICLKTNGVAFGTFATQNYATPPAIGGTTPAAGNFTTLGATGNLTTNVTGVAANCLEANTSGVVSGTGSGCGGGGGSGTVTSVTCTQGLSGGAITTTGTCGLIGSLTPQGRLTLVSATPVMTADETAKATIYYDCYAGKAVPYYDGSNDQALTVGSCEISTALESSGTGQQLSAGVFDVFAINVSGTLTLCVPTDGSGHGWASDTGGSNTARGTGYSQVHNTRGYYTNVNSITHCYNAATDEGSISADRGTYLGSFYTTANGQTGVQSTPAAASAGTLCTVGLWNAYNRVTLNCYSQDSKSSWTTTSAWGSMDASTANRINIVDGLGQSALAGEVTVFTEHGAGNQAMIGIDLDSTSATPVCAASIAGGTNGQISTPCSYQPQIGLHFLQAMQASNSGTSTFFGSGAATNTQSETMELLGWSY